MGVVLVCTAVADVGIGPAVAFALVGLGEFDFAEEGEAEWGDGHCGEMNVTEDKGNRCM